MPFMPYTILCSCAVYNEEWDNQARENGVGIKKHRRNDGGVAGVAMTGNQEAVGRGDGRRDNKRNGGVAAGGVINGVAAAA